MNWRNSISQLFCILGLSFFSVSLIAQEDNILESKFLQAVSLEEQDMLDTAVVLLLDVIDEAMKIEAWDLLVKAQIQLALVFEKSEHLESCLEQLKAADESIKKYQISQEQAWLWVRQSSYFRMMGQIDSAISYAEKASKVDVKEQGVRAKGDAYLLLTILFRDSIPEKSVAYAKKAVTLFRNADAIISMVNMLSNISKIYQINNQPELALNYNDSVFYQIAENGLVDSIPFRYIFYKMRAKIYKQLEIMDSAFFYQKIGHQLELDFLDQQNTDRVVEIQAEYNDEKKGILIEQQKRQLISEGQQRLILWIVLLLILFLLFLLFYYNRQLVKSKRKSEALAARLLESNKKLSEALHQQKLLLGEVHHRVKNNLQIIISLLELQIEELEENKLTESLNMMKNRIFSMAAIHELIYQQENMEVVDLNVYIKTLFAHIVDSLSLSKLPQIQMDLIEKSFDLPTLIPLGIMLNELFTNSIKYSDASNQLKIQIRLEKEKDGFLLRYQDNGKGYASGLLEEREGGLGTYLLKSMTRQMNGHLESYNDDGAVVCIHFKENAKL